MFEGEADIAQGGKAHPELSSASLSKYSFRWAAYPHSLLSCLHLKKLFHQKVCLQVARPELKDGMQW